MCPLLDELQKEPKRIPVSGNSSRADVLLVDQPFAKKPLEQCGEVTEVVLVFHLGPPLLVSTDRSNRRVATASNSGIAVMYQYVSVGLT